MQRRKFSLICAYVNSILSLLLFITSSTTNEWLHIRMTLQTVPPFLDEALKNVDNQMLNGARTIRSNELPLPTFNHSNPVKWRTQSKSQTYNDASNFDLQQMTTIHSTAESSKKDLGKIQNEKVFLKYGRLERTLSLIRLCDIRLRPYNERKRLLLEKNQTLILSINMTSMNISEQLKRFQKNLLNPKLLCHIINYWPSKPRISLNNDIIHDSLSYLTSRDPAPAVMDGLTGLLVRSAMFMFSGSFLSLIAFALFLFSLFCLEKLQCQYAVLAAGIIHVVSGLSSLVGLVIFIATFVEDISEKYEQYHNTFRYKYSYGYSFLLAVLAFVCSEFSGVLAVYWYIIRYTRNTNKKEQQNYDKTSGRKGEGSNYSLFAPIVGKGSINLQQGQQPFSDETDTKSTESKIIPVISNRKRSGRRLSTVSILVNDDDKSHSRLSLDIPSSSIGSENKRHLQHQQQSQQHKQEGEHEHGGHLQQSTFSFSQTKPNLLEVPSVEELSLNLIKTSKNQSFGNNSPKNEQKFNKQIMSHIKKPDTQTKQKYSVDYLLRQLKDDYSLSNQHSEKNITTTTISTITTTITTTSTLANTTTTIDSTGNKKKKKKKKPQMDTNRYNDVILPVALIDENKRNPNNSTDDKDNKNDETFNQYLFKNHHQTHQLQHLPQQQQQQQQQQPINKSYTSSNQFGKYNSISTSTNNKNLPNHQSVAPCFNLTGQNEFSINRQIHRNKKPQQQQQQQQQPLLQKTIHTNVDPLYNQSDLIPLMNETLCNNSTNKNNPNNLIQSYDLEKAYSPSTIRQFNMINESEEQNAHNIHHVQQQQHLHRHPHQPQQPFHHHHDRSPLIPLAQLSPKPNFKNNDENNQCSYYCYHHHHYYPTNSHNFPIWQRKSEQLHDSSSNGQYNHPMNHPTLASKPYMTRSTTNETSNYSGIIQHRPKFPQYSYEEPLISEEDDPSYYIDRSTWNKQPLTSMIVEPQKNFNELKYRSASFSPKLLNRLNNQQFFDNTSTALPEEYLTPCKEIIPCHLKKTRVVCRDAPSVSENRYHPMQRSFITPLSAPLSVRTAKLAEMHSEFLNKNEMNEQKDRSKITSISTSAMENIQKHKNYDYSNEQKVKFKRGTANPYFQEHLTNPKRVTMTGHGAIKQSNTISINESMDHRYRQIGQANMDGRRSCMKKMNVRSPKEKKSNGKSVKNKTIVHLDPELESVDNEECALLKNDLKLTTSIPTMSTCKGNVKANEGHDQLLIDKLLPPKSSLKKHLSSNSDVLRPSEMKFLKQIKDTYELKMNNNLDQKDAHSFQSQPIATSQPTTEGLPTDSEYPNCKYREQISPIQMIYDQTKSSGIVDEHQQQQQQVQLQSLDRHVEFSHSQNQLNLLQQQQQHENNLDSLKRIQIHNSPQHYKEEQSHLLSHSHQPQQTAHDIGNFSLSNSLHRCNSSSHIHYPQAHLHCCCQFQYQLQEHYRHQQYYNSLFRQNYSHSANYYNYYPTSHDYRTSTIMQSSPCFADSCPIRNRTNLDGPLDQITGINRQTEAPPSQLHQTRKKSSSFHSKMDCFQLTSPWKQGENKMKENYNEQSSNRTTERSSTSHTQNTIDEE
ncbi:hypothetical protein SNEBB_006428 [Seison nebaliae]|nr:hypothetical protein SNEBB_006428 [Seison nebaliae]